MLLVNMHDITCCTFEIINLPLLGGKTKISNGYTIEVYPLEDQFVIEETDEINDKFQF